MTDHNFFVDLLRAVRPLVAQRPRRAPVSVAKRRHIHAQQLEFGAHIRAGEGFILPCQRGGGHACHLVARGNQSKDFPFPQRAFANGKHVTVGSLAAIVNADPAALADSQPAAARQRVLRTDTGRKDHQVRFQRFAIGKAQHQPVIRRRNFRGGFSGVNAHAQRLDFLAQHRRAVVIELNRHQIGRKLHHVSVEPELFQGVCCLQPQQPASDDDPATRTRRMGRNVVEIVERAVDKTARQIVTRYRRDKRV